MIALTIIHTSFLYFHTLLLRLTVDQWHFVERTIESVLKIAVPGGDVEGPALKFLKVDLADLLEKGLEVLIILDVVDPE